MFSLMTLKIFELTKIISKVDIYLTVYWCLCVYLCGALCKDYCCIVPFNSCVRVCVVFLVDGTWKSIEVDVLEQREKQHV